jgi:hypothetical protein
MPNSIFKICFSDFSNQAKLFSLWQLLKYNLHKEKHLLFVGYYEHIRNVQVERWLSN